MQRSEIAFMLSCERRPGLILRRFRFLFSRVFPKELESLAAPLTPHGSGGVRFLRRRSRLPKKRLWRRRRGPASSPRRACFRSPFICAADFRDKHFHPLSGCQFSHPAKQRATVSQSGPRRPIVLPDCHISGSAKGDLMLLGIP